jgi:hypothetical protein
MTINVCGSSQDQILKVVNQNDGDSSQVKQVLKAKLVINKKIKKQSQGYNLGYFSLWWNRMDREGVKHALETKRMQEDARTSARLRMLIGASRDAVLTALKMIIQKIQKLYKERCLKAKQKLRMRTAPGYQL